MSDTFIIALSIFASVYLIAFLIFLGFRQNLRFKERQLELETRVRMDDFRSHFEREVTGLNKEFASNSQRFQELNHLVISGQSGHRELSESHLQQSEFLRAHGITLAGTQIRPRSIFVLTPFHKDFDAFSGAVSEVGRDTNYLVSRGDERVDKSDIFTQILYGIVTSRFIIANITGRNANVFYELGVAHALDKEVILVAESEAEVPFDLQSKRILFYDSIDELKAKLATALARLAEA